MNNVDETEVKRMTTTGIRTLKAKNNRIATRLSDDEYAFIIDYAKKNGISASSAIRQAIMALMQAQRK